jgi:hypothetical protein
VGNETDWSPVQVKMVGVLKTAQFTPPISHMSAGVEYEYTTPDTSPSEYATMPRTPETTPRNGRGEHSLAGFMMDGLDQRNQVTWPYSLRDPRAMRNNGILEEFLRRLHTSELKLVCGVVDLVVNRRTLYSTGCTRFTCDQREDIQNRQQVEWDNMCAEWREIFNDERRNDLETYTDICMDPYCELAQLEWLSDLIHQELTRNRH